MPDRYQSTISAPNPSDAPDLLSGDPLAWLVNTYNQLLPSYRSPARPQSPPIPGLGRRVDLMSAIDLISNLAAPERAEGAQLATLLAPGWVRNPRAAAREDIRSYIASITVPNKKLPIQLTGNFKQLDTPGVWELGWLGKLGSMGDPGEFRGGPHGSLWSDQSSNLGTSGIRQLLQRFRRETPDARWITFHRAGGAAPKGNAAEAFLLRPRAGEQAGFVNAQRDAYKPQTDPRWQRYQTYLREVHGLNLTPRAPAHIVRYDPLDEP